MSTQETVLFIDGPEGKLEALYLEQEDAKGMVLICHPHPLYLGTMQNKVVATLQRTSRDENYTTLRFNFRGVGKSDGVYDKGRGETNDALAAAHYLLKHNPNKPLTLIGFSFGACISVRLACELEKQGIAIKQLILIAPAVGYINLDDYLPQKTPLIIIQPEADEVVSPQAVYTWASLLPKPHILLTVPACSHFFHGRLNDLKEIITPYLSK